MIYGCTINGVGKMWSSAGITKGGVGGVDGARLEADQ